MRRLKAGVISVAMEINLESRCFLPCPTKETYRF
ncbi:hypothetical protein SPHINGOT1_660054 [Sphingomonas sp. T1]|nr:hypothetical protein SPHINGOT1_660054 [Sphingomonas sp. T1]